MIEIIIKDYLSRALDCPVKLEKDGRPFGRSVFIEKTGGRGRPSFSSFTGQSSALDK